MDAALLFIVGAGAAIAGSAVSLGLSAARRKRRLGELRRAVEAMIDAGESARLELGGDRELRELGHAVNRMADERDRAHDAVRVERDRLARILDGMGEGVLLTNGEERIALANRAFRNMAAVGDDAIGRPVIEAVRSAALVEALDAAREHGEPVVREIELGRVLPRKLLVRVSPMPLGNGGEPGAERGGTLAVFHDVTDLRRLETIRTDFVANVSHELRTPVTAISTAAETLLGGALGDAEASRDFVEVIDRNAARLRHLVDDLLDLSRLESKSFRLAPTTLDLHPILLHAASLSRDAAQRRKVTIVVDPAIDTALRAFIDRRALEQVLSNLLDNAIKYAGEGARVTLSARAEGDDVEVTVADNGVGISPTHLGRLFERFYRVDTGRSRELGGTGLGLSIVKHLIERMNGTIEVESELGEGACFTLRLPAAERA
ncbi:MAG: ATP-binding protein [Byssovorax sp.]